MPSAADPRSLLTCCLNSLPFCWTDWHKTGLLEVSYPPLQSYVTPFLASLSGFVSDLITEDDIKNTSACHLPASQGRLAQSAAAPPHPELHGEINNCLLREEYSFIVCRWQRWNSSSGILGRAALNGRLPMPNISPTSYINFTSMPIIHKSYMHLSFICFRESWI